MSDLFIECKSLIVGLKTSIQTKNVLLLLKGPKICINFCRRKSVIFSRWFFSLSRWNNDEVFCQPDHYKQKIAFKTKMLEAVHRKVCVCVCVCVYEHACERERERERERRRTHLCTFLSSMTISHKRALAQKPFFINDRILEPGFTKLTQPRHSFFQYLF